MIKLKARLKSFLLAGGALMFAICLLIMPAETVAASKRGLDIWTGSVFPSLLPFFITGELLIGFGVVHFIGVLFEPIMKPVFNVPGVGSFVWAMGMASGYPAGAKFTARMRQEGHLNKVEAERLIAFTNASNPLFIIAVVSVSFLKAPSLGLLLVIAHYGSNLLVGFLMRFYKMGEQPSTRTKSSEGIWRRAFETLHQTRIKQSKPFGKLFGDAVIHSVQTLLMIGGFIMIFSVLSSVLIETGILVWISQLLESIFLLFKLPPTLALPFSIGLFEITIGVQQIASYIDEALVIKAILVSILLAFNGLSIHAQVASILADTDIKFSPYFFGRLIQGLFSACIVIFSYPFILTSNKAPIGQAIPVQGLFFNQLWDPIISFISQYGIMISLITLWTSLFIYSYRLIKH
ncbi:sporulation integral membrane protein YlbJ [Amphibacillus sp. Q70]|uniref:sporulation integral membrane protein YlbJ n=1 Tax=Amphibacillus sp. Q70 TaxID=3453416 RepID=UPI003F82D1E2